MFEHVLAIVTALVSSAFAAGGAYAAVRVELSQLRRDVDRAHDRLDHVDGVLLDHASRLPHV